MRASNTSRSAPSAGLARWITRSTRQRDPAWRMLVVVPQRQHQRASRHRDAACRSPISLHPHLAKLSVRSTWTSCPMTYTLPSIHAIYMCASVDTSIGLHGMFLILWEAEAVLRLVDLESHLLAVHASYRCLLLRIPP
jgi:hypothetical protein